MIPCRRRAPDLPSVRPRPTDGQISDACGRTAGRQRAQRERCPEPIRRPPLSRHPGHRWGGGAITACPRCPPTCTSSLRYKRVRAFHRRQETMNWRDHITSDPDVLRGKPVIKGTRISVEHVLGLLENGWSEADILESYPHLTPGGIRACLGFAREITAEEKLYPSPSS